MKNSHLKNIWRVIIFLSLFFILSSTSFLWATEYTVFWSVFGSAGEFIQSEENKVFNTVGQVAIGESENSDYNVQIGYIIGKIFYINEAPIINFIYPKDSIQISGKIKLIWTDKDSDNNALINLYWDSDKNINNNTEDTKGKRWGQINIDKDGNVILLYEDPDEEGDKYTLDPSIVPVWCPWQRYFYILATIDDKVNLMHYDYSGKIEVITKASEGGSALSIKEAMITIPPNVLPCDIFLTIETNPQSFVLSTANAKLINSNSIYQSNSLMKTTHEFKARTLTGDFLTKLNKGNFEITLKYDQEALTSIKTKEENLYLAYLNKENWEIIKNHKVDKNKMFVSAMVNRFGTYTLVEVATKGIEIGHYPTPAKYPEDKSITFCNLKDNINKGEELKIYNRAGELIRTIVVYSDANDELSWNLRNDSGEIVASDVYFYVVRKKDGKSHIGKMMVIK